MAPYTVSDVARGLQGLRNSLRDDLHPVLQATMHTPEGGYFIVPREVFAYIDFLGALYSGYGGEVDGAGRQRIASGAKAIRFLEEVLGKVDTAYVACGRLAYEMFRHGTIHVYRPHALRRADGTTIEWLAYKGERSNAPVLYEDQTLSVRHLEPYVFDAASPRYILPLSINVLYDDLLRAIDIYEEEVARQIEQGDFVSLRNYESTMDALMRPEPTNLTW